MQVFQEATVGEKLWCQTMQGLHCGGSSESIPEGLYYVGTCVKPLLTSNPLGGTFEAFTYPTYMGSTLYCVVR